MRLLVITLPLWWMTCLQADPRFNQTVPDEPAAPVVHPETALYDSAVAWFRAKQFARCDTTFRVLRDSFPQTPEAEKAAYMLGYLYTHFENPAVNYTTAKAEFDRFLTLYPASRYASDSRSWIRAIAIMDSLEKRPTVIRGSNTGLIEENRRLKAEIEELKLVIERLERIIKKN
jgi:hypothetical protein